MHLFHKVKGDFIKIKCNHFWGGSFSTLDLGKEILNLGHWTWGMGKVKSHSQVIRESLG